MEIGGINPETADISWYELVMSVAVGKLQKCNFYFEINATHELICLFRRGSQWYW